MAASSVGAQSSTGEAVSESGLGDQPLRAISPKRLSGEAVERLVADRAEEEDRWQPAWPGELEPVPPSLEARLLESLCVGGLDSDAPGGPVCRRCPAFTTRGGRAGEFRLEGVARGAFFEKGASELFVTYRGCEPERAASGGAVGFRREEGTWRVFYRHPGLRPDACVALSEEGQRDQLICRLRSRVEGRTIDRVFAVRKKGVKTLVKARDDRESCSGEAVRGSLLRGWRLESESEGRTTLAVGKLARRRPLSSEDGGSDRSEGSQEESGGNDAAGSASGDGGPGTEEGGSAGFRCEEGEIDWKTRQQTVHRYEYRGGKVREKSVEERAPDER